MRTLTHAPGFTATAVVTLAAGIGAAVTMATVYLAVVINPVRLPDPGAVVSIAHDDRLARPSWLTRQFQPTGEFLMIDHKHRLTIFAHHAARDDSLTLGANAEMTGAKAGDVTATDAAEGLMYLVFVKRDSAS